MKTCTVQTLLHYIYQSKKKRLSCIIMSGSSRSQLDIYDVCSAHKTGKRLLHAHCATFLCVLINQDQERIILDLVKSYGIKINRKVSKTAFKNNCTQDYKEAVVTCYCSTFCRPSRVVLARSKLQVNDVLTARCGLDQKLELLTSKRKHLQSFY